MEKISWDLAFQNTTFFLIDSTIEAFYEIEITKRVSNIVPKIARLNEENGVLNFIKEDEESLSTLITLLGISGERFKRIVSMIRSSYGHIFDTEWDYKTNMRNKLLENPNILAEVCELFQRGYVSPKFTSRIPRLILQKFKIDDSILKRVNNIDFLKELIQTKLDVEYYTKYKEAYHDIIYQKIEPVANKYGLVVLQNTTLEGCVYPAALIVKSGNKMIAINECYNLTTGQGQTTYQRNLAQMYSVLRDNPNAMVINMLDGAGWIGRGSDCKQIFLNCHHFLNLKSLDKIEQIIIDFFNIDKQ